MNILILHRIPYYKIEYHRGIDHAKHHVVYIGTAENIANLPENLSCQKIIRAGKKDIENEIVDYIKQSPYPFDRIISLSEYELMTAAKLRELFNVEGPKPLEVELVRNKLTMKTALANAGIKVPAFASLESLLSNKAFSHVGKVVIKPIDGASSKDVILCKNVEYAIKTVQQGNTGITELDQRLKSLDAYEIEAFIEGKIFHIDGLVQNGKLVGCLASQYVGTCLDYAKGKPLGSVQIATTITMQEWTQRCIEAVQIKNGSFHLEAIESSEGLVFLEIANRVGGADVVKTFELATSIHLPSCELKFMLGEDSMKTNIKQSSYCYGWFVFPGHQLVSGFAKTINSHQCKHHRFILNWYELQEDQPCQKHITYQPHEVPIAGIVKGNDSQELIQFLQHMFNRVSVVDKKQYLENVA
ncbi:MAG TPA: ATP-grasp domain-containing protein [Gammaproteobacteria bacterium]|nr:ATP-grasp domain-containing protein [Gammaproteobacteria bacterium]